MARFTFGTLQKQCMDDIAQGKKIAAVARKYGVHRATIHRWLKRDEVMEYLLEQKESEHFKTLIQLEKQLDDPNPWRRMKAASKLLDMLMPEPEVRIIFK